MSPRRTEYMYSYVTASARGWPDVVAAAATHAIVHSAAYHPWISAPTCVNKISRSSGLRAHNRYSVHTKAYRIMYFGHTRTFTIVTRMGVYTV
jgi:hypothetical protein